MVQLRHAKVQTFFCRSRPVLRSSTGEGGGNFPSCTGGTGYQPVAIGNLPTALFIRSSLLLDPYTIFAKRTHRSHDFIGFLEKNEPKQTKFMTRINANYRDLTPKMKNRTQTSDWHTGRDAALRRPGIGEHRRRVLFAMSRRECLEMFEAGTPQTAAGTAALPLVISQTDRRGRF
jgi:hypothetical protein